MKRIAVITAALAIAAPALAAQGLRPEIRPFAGVSVPTGDQRDVFKTAAMFGLQTALEVKPFFHVVGTFGWMPADHKYAGAGAGGLAPDADVNILSYNAGVELGLVQPLGGAWEVRPFIGIGAGARTYLFQGAALSDKTCAAGYAALGTEFQIRHVALRLEARDNVFCYRSPLPNVGSETRNDLGFALGLAYHIR